MKNYGTMEKTIVLWKKLWYYGQNFGSILRNMEFPYTKEKMEDYQKLRDFDL